MRQLDEIGLDPIYSTFEDLQSLEGEWTPVQSARSKARRQEKYPCFSFYYHKTQLVHTTPHQSLLLKTAIEDVSDNSKVLKIRSDLQIYDPSLFQQFVSRLSSSAYAFTTIDYGSQLREETGEIFHYSDFLFSAPAQILRQAISQLENKYINQSALVFSLQHQIKAPSFSGLNTFPFSCEQELWSSLAEAYFYGTKESVVHGSIHTLDLLQLDYLLRQSVNIENCDLIGVFLPSRLRTEAFASKSDSCKAFMRSVQFLKSSLLPVLKILPAMHSMRFIQLSTPYMYKPTKHS